VLLIYTAHSKDIMKFLTSTDMYNITSNSGDIQDISKF